MNLRVFIGCLLVAPAPALSAEPDSTEELQTVVVTGSRIRGAPEDRTAPVTVISQTELARGGNESLGRALQALPYNTGAPGNTNVNNGGDGATRVDLRGLTPRRTLVLLNGRRLPNSGVGADSSVDIDTLPLSLVAKVEVLTTGASTVYGADAIGGVINVITRRDFDGAEAGVQFSQASHGDGAIRRAQLAIGGEMHAGSWMAGLDYVDQTGVAMDQRAYSAAQYRVLDASGARIESGSPNIADGRFRVDRGNALALAPGPYTRVAGATGQGAADWRPVTDADTFNFSPYNLLQTPTERATAWLVGQLDISEALESFVEVTATRRESAQILAPAPYMLLSGAAPSLPNGRPHIPANNHYNPFGVPVLMGGRRIVELGDRGFEQQVDSWRALAGLRGELGGWHWEMSASRAESESVALESGVPLADRFAVGLGPSGPDAAGNIVCGVPDLASGLVPAGAVVPDCVPIDLFNGAGSITQHQLDFIAVQLREPGTNSQTLFNATLDGAWGRSWAGDMTWAFGLELRREHGNFGIDTRRVGAGPAGDIPAASFETVEGFVELRVPFAATLDATLGARFADFSSFGTQPSAHAGLRWKPAEAWTLRADYSQLYRAPALAELYERQVINDDRAFDPCGNNPTPAQRENCTANGVPGGSYEQDPASFHSLESGGNPALDPEEGFSFDAGVQWQPHPELELRLDYFRTRLNDYISAQDPEFILQECANRGTPVACANIERFDDGTLDAIDARTSNFGRVELAGIDASADLRLPISAGVIGARVLATHLLSHDSQPFEGGGTLENAGRARGGVVLPRWRALAGIDFTRGSWSAAYAAQWIGSFDTCTLALSDEVYCAQVPDVIYHDVECAYRWHDWSFEAGVNNLGDEDPPFIDAGAANTDPATYRLLGRTWFARAGLSLN